MLAESGHQDAYYKVNEYSRRVNLWMLDSQHTSFHLELGHWCRFLCAFPVA